LLGEASIKNALLLILKVGLSKTRW
jgi:hypothetical protein